MAKGLIAEFRLSSAKAPPMSKLVPDCSIDDHVVLKTDPVRLRSATPVHGRPQKFEGEILFYFRECPACGSSLTIEPEVEEAARAG